eukprot:214343-Chlamydomonas_euryale.AAC.4
MQPAPTKSSASLNESGTLPARSRSVLMRLCKRSDTSARHCGVARSGACECMHAPVSTGSSAHGQRLAQKVRMRMVANCSCWALHGSSNRIQEHVSRWLEHRYAEVSRCFHVCSPTCCSTRSSARMGHIPPHRTTSHRRALA